MSLFSIAALVCSVGALFVSVLVMPPPGRLVAIGYIAGVLTCGIAVWVAK